MKTLAKSLALAGMLALLMGAPVQQAFAQDQTEATQTDKAAEKAAKKAEKKAQKEAAKAEKQKAKEEAAANKEAEKMEKKAAIETPAAPTTESAVSYSGDKWEYQAFKLQPPKRTKWLKKWNDLGDEGWEFVATYENYYIFKRPLGK